MTATLFFRKTRIGLIPDDAVDPRGREWILKIKNGASVKVRRPVLVRNPQHHRKFFAMMNLIFKNQTYFKSMEELLGAAKLAVGHCDLLETKMGLVAIPKSIEFDKMDQHQFNAFYDGVVAWVVEAVIPGLERRDVAAQVLDALRDF